MGLANGPSGLTRWPLFLKSWSVPTFAPRRTGRAALSLPCGRGQADRVPPGWRAGAARDRPRGTVLREPPTAGARALPETVLLDLVETILVYK